MGSKDLLQHLPGGENTQFLHSFYGLEWNGKHILFDAAGALWQFTSNHAWGFLRGNHTPSLIEWAQFLVYLRSMYKWKLVVCFDGMEYEDKAPEIE